MGDYYCLTCDTTHSKAIGCPKRRSTNPKVVEGRKKPRSSFTPVAVLREIDAGMTEGALKYGPYNWRDTDIEASDYYDSTMRHMRSFWEGEDIDPDSGVSHITKAITGLIVLRDAQLHGTCVDDRPYSNKQPSSEKTDELYRCCLQNRGRPHTDACSAELRFIHNEMITDDQRDQ